MTSENFRLPPKEQAAIDFINQLKKNRRFNITKSDSIKLAEARMVLALYSCKRENLLPTVSNLTLILGKDAASTFKIITPAYYSQYNIIKDE